MSPGQLELLHSILERRDFEQSSRPSFDLDALDQEGRVRLQLILVDELLEFGLDPADEHNEYGHVIEGLISALNRLPLPEA